MARNQIQTCVIAFTLLAVLSPLSADNAVPNPGFTGDTGAIVAVNEGVITAPGGVPDFWRTFAVGAGGNVDIEVVPLAAGELFPGSPATNAVLFRVNSFGADQGFDNDNGRFAIFRSQHWYNAEFYVKTANADDSAQGFNFGFPLFAGPPEAPGGFLGVEPGRAINQSATSSWQKISGPSFKAPPEAGNGHISFRAIDDGGENAFLIAMPTVMSPPDPEFANVPAMSWQGYSLLLLALMGSAVLILFRVRPASTLS